MPTYGAGAAATVVGTTVRVCVGTGVTVSAVVVITGGGGTCGRLDVGVGAEGVDDAVVEVVVGVGVSKGYKSFGTFTVTVKGDDDEYSEFVFNRRGFTGIDWKLTDIVLPQALPAAQASGGVSAGGLAGWLAGADKQRSGSREHGGAYSRAKLSQIRSGDDSGRNRAFHSAWRMAYRI